MSESTATAALKTSTSLTPFQYPVIPWDGKPISRPGIYSGMPIETYHTDICVGPSISSTGVRLIEDKSLAHFWDKSYLNPEFDPDDFDDDTAAFKMGRAAHILYLGEKGFAEKFAVRPDEAPDGRDWNGNNKSCKEWVAARKAEKRAVLTRDEVEILRGMAASLAKDPVVKLGLINGLIEHSMFWLDEATGIWIKARPDAIPTNVDIIADLKTVADASAYGARKSIRERAYHIQLALAGICLEKLTGRILGNDDYALLFVEKKRPYCVNLKPVDIVDIWYGRCQIRRALNALAEAIRTGNFSGYADNGATAALPDWYRKELERQMVAGLLPKSF